MAQGELGDAHALHPLERLELPALDMLEQLELELLDPLKQLELRALGDSPKFLSPRPSPAHDELGDAHVLHPLELLELHAVDLPEPLDLELLEPSEQLELLALGGPPNLCFCRRAPVRGAG